MPPAVLEDRRFNPYPRLGGTNQRVSAVFQRGLSAQYGAIYACQPAVRSVVDYIAKNSAQLPLKLFERISDTERERDEEHPAAQSLKNPDDWSAADAFLRRLFQDFLIYDNAYVVKFPVPNGGPVRLIRIPPESVTVSGGRFTPDLYVLWATDGVALEVQPDRMIHWFGYNPDDPLMGLSPLETLRQELATDAAIQAALVEVAKHGFKGGGYIFRPIEAPEWEQDDAERYAERFREQRQRTDGFVPIMDEGMEWRETGLSAKDAEVIASRQFTEAEVLKAYIGPFGLKPDGDIEAQRKQIYADVLPPLTKALACQLDVDILRAEYQADSYYFEFDLNEKLRGDIENRFPMMTSAAGRPWLTVNEVRAIENKPPVEGGDDLTIPTNVVLAGPDGTAPQLPAPNVMPIQDPNKPPQDGSYREGAAGNGLVKADVPGTVPPDHRLPHFQSRLRNDMARQRRNVSEFQGMIHNYFERQSAAMKERRIAGKAFDSHRWDAELTRDLQAELKRVVDREASFYVGQLGGADFDMRQVDNYLMAMAAGIASGVNAATQADLEAGTAQDAIDRAMSQRAAVVGASLGARATIFARAEAAKQSPGYSQRMQTWIADTDRHADLDGVTVPVGSDWGGIEPGSEPNCACSVSIS